MHLLPVGKHSLLSSVKLLRFVGHLTKLPQTISKGILQVLCDKKVHSLSKLLHTVVGPKHIQGFDLLTENTIGFSLCCPCFNKLTKRHDSTPHKHTHTRKYTPQVGMTQEVRTVAMMSHRGQLRTRTVKHVDVLIFWQSDLDARNVHLFLTLSVVRRWCFPDSRAVFHGL